MMKSLKNLGLSQRDFARHLGVRGVGRGACPMMPSQERKSSCDERA
jgi:hypothetical protein